MKLLVAVQSTVKPHPILELARPETAPLGGTRGRSPRFLSRRRGPTLKRHGMSAADSPLIRSTYETCSRDRRWQDAVRGVPESGLAVAGGGGGRKMPAERAGRAGAGGIFLLGQFRRSFLRWAESLGPIRFHGAGHFGRAVHARGGGLRIGRVGVLPCVGGSGGGHL